MIDQGMSKRSMCGRRDIAPIGTPVQRDDEVGNFCPGSLHDLEEPVSLLILHANGYVPDPRALLSCCPGWFVVSTGNESELPPFYFPYSWFRSLLQRHSCSSIMNTCLL